MKKKYIAPETKLVLLDSRVLRDIGTGASGNEPTGTKEAGGWDDGSLDDESDGLW